MKTSVLGWKQEIRQLGSITSPADGDVFLVQNVTDNLLYKIAFSDLEGALNLVSFENATVYFEDNAVFN